MNSFFYEKILRPLLFRFDAETAHHLAMTALKNFPQRLLRTIGSNPKLPREVFGIHFPNPVGLAAGFDKNAMSLSAWAALGFGFVEAGTITAHAQPGNPKPRVFRFTDQRALVNRMGFNNDGAEVVAARLRNLREANQWPKIPVGLNIGKSKVTPLGEATADYLASFSALYPFGDYFVLNVSSPNTPGLRELQNKTALDELLGAVQAQNRAQKLAKPLLIKIAPDLDFAQIDEILERATAHGLAGIVATNTTLDHSSIPARDEAGGLSGAPLRKRATEIVRFISSKSSLPIIASGGVMDVESAREKFAAGASLVQIYTGFIYRGPSLIEEICRAERNFDER